MNQGQGSTDFMRHIGEEAHFGLGNFGFFFVFQTLDDQLILLFYGNQGVFPENKEQEKKEQSVQEVGPYRKVHGRIDYKGKLPHPGGPNTIVVGSPDLQGIGAKTQVGIGYPAILTAGFLDRKSTRLNSSHVR